MRARRCVTELGSSAATFFFMADAEGFVGWAGGAAAAASAASARASAAAILEGIAAAGFGSAFGAGAGATVLPLPLAAAKAACCRSRAARTASSLALADPPMGWPRPYTNQFVTAQASASVAMAANIGARRVAGRRFGRPHG